MTSLAWLHTLDHVTAANVRRKDTMVNAGSFDFKEGGFWHSESFGGRENDGKRFFFLINSILSYEIIGKKIIFSYFP